MATITFQNGTKVNFNGNPTPEDVDFVAKQLGITAQSAAQPQAPQKTTLDKISNTLGDVFGGKVIGEGLGTLAARQQARQGKGVVEADYSKLSPQAIEKLRAQGVPISAEAQREEVTRGIKGPSAKQIVGDVGRVALNFVPAGKATTALGVTGRIAKPALNLLEAGALGYAGDVTTNLAENKAKPFTPGLGTGIGAGLAAVPIVGRAIGKLGNEAVGLSTGAGAGNVKEFTRSIAQGGETAQAARDAMRGRISEQDIVDEAKGAFGQFLKNRSDEYAKQLDTLKTKTNKIDHQPVIDKFNKMLEDYGVFSNADGTPNFSRAPGLGRYQRDLEALSKTLSEWGTQPGDNTIAGVDRLKQVIDDFRIGSSDSRKFDAFVTGLRGEAKNAVRSNLQGDLKTLGTYEKMLGDYEKSTKDIRDIQRSLSLGDKASTDTAFKKLSSVLRTDNEMRRNAVEQLDELTGGKLLPKIAGQRMSELAPRGLVSRGALVGGAAFTGILPMLKFAAVASPRVMGELLNALGIVGGKAALVKNELRQLAQQGALIGASQNDQ